MSQESCSNSTPSEWIPWTVKNQRPASMPGCQNVDDSPSLCVLGEGQIICGGQTAHQEEEGADYCYNFRCIKCMPVYMVDYYNGQHQSTLVTVPPIDSLRPPLFEQDSGYEGEVVEFYDNYLSRMPELTGFAINGWKTENARLVFDSVEKTFSGSIYTKTKDFEIDWLLINASVLTVVEIGMREESDVKKNTAKKSKQEKEDTSDDVDKGAERLVARKIDQLIKDQVVIRHLLEVANIQNCCINYLAVFPNMPIDLIRSKIETTYKRALDELCGFSGGNYTQFGVICSNSIADLSVHLYGSDGQLLQPIRFEFLMTPEAGWNDALMYITSLLVASLLKSVDASVSDTSKPIKSDDNQSTSHLLSYWESEKETNIRKTAHYVTRFNAKSRGRDRLVKYPKDLIFGPEQIEVIETSEKHEVNIFLLTGEAGCGKTTTLLAIMFKHAGKHVSERNRRKVVFFLPEEKKNLREDIRRFVEQNCFAEWVQLSPLHCLDTTLLNTENIYLIDEFYGPAPELTKKLAFSRGTFYIATISTQSKHGMLQSGISKDVRNWYFRRLYRSTSEISKVCAKLRRLMDRKVESESHMDIPWAMSFYNGPPMRERSSVEVSSYSDRRESLKDKMSRYGSLRSAGKTLLVTWQIDRELLNNVGIDTAGYTIYCLNSEVLSVDDLHFTGSEFRNVIVLLGETVEPDSEHTTLLLYNSVTRATEQVHVLCFETIESDLKSILSLSTNTDIIFEKLRSSDIFGADLLSSIRNSEDRLEIMKRIVATKNHTQFKKLKEKGFFETANFSREETQLVQCMEVMINSPKSSRSMIELFLLEKKISTPGSNITLDMVRPILQFFEPLGITIPPEGHHVSSLSIDPQALDLNDKLALVTSFFHEYDFSLTITEWISKLTHGNEKQVSNIMSFIDTQKAEKFIKPVLGVLSNISNDEILRNSVLLMDGKRVLSYCNKLSLDVFKTFTKKLHDGSTLIHKFALGATQHTISTIFDCFSNNELKFSDGNLQDNCGQNPLMTAIGNTGAFFEITSRAKRQRDLGRLLDLRDKFGWSCLRWACRVGNLKVVKTLIENEDMKLDWKSDLDPEGRTLIHLVSWAGHTHILGYLLTLDQKLDFMVSKTMSLQGMSCLHAACLFGRVGIVRMLLEAVPHLISLEFHGINCLTLASRSFFEDNKRIADLLKDTLSIQKLNGSQEELMVFVHRQIRSLNHNNFVDENEKAYQKSDLRGFCVLFVLLPYLKQSFETTTTMLQDALPWSEAIVFSNLQPDFKDEHQISKNIPADIAKGLIKIEVYGEEKVAVVNFLEESFAVDSLNYFYQNPAVLGQVQINPGFLLWNLKKIEPDPEWLSASRFADNEELRYSLRSLEKFAPWIRHVFIVTNGQIPAWLDLEAPRLTIVTHDQLFPPQEGYLPTFSSPAIESQLHKIPGLSKHFLYFNDDVMLGQPVYPQDFFSHQTGYKIYPGWPVPSCKDDCPNAWLHDGYCDAACNNAECDFDGGDCLHGANAPSGNQLSNLNGAPNAPQLGGADGSLRGWREQDLGCAYSCSDAWLGDRYCDMACNKRVCGFDMGDCGISGVMKLNMYNVEPHQKSAPVVNSATFNHPYHEPSFAFNLSSYLASEGRNVSKVYYDKTAYVRAVKFLKGANVIQVVLSRVPLQVSSAASANISIHVELTKKSSLESSATPTPILNITTLLFSVETKKDINSFVNRSAEVKLEKLELVGKNPKVLTVLPVETSNLQTGDARQTLEKIDSALLPANVTKFLEKMSSWLEEKRVTESVYNEIVSDLLAPYLSLLPQPRNPHPKKGVGKHRKGKKAHDKDDVDTYKGPANRIDLVPVAHPKEPEEGAGIGPVMPRQVEKAEPEVVKPEEHNDNIVQPQQSLNGIDEKVLESFSNRKLQSVVDSESNREVKQQEKENNGGVQAAGMEKKVGENESLDVKNQSGAAAPADTVVVSKQNAPADLTKDAFRDSLRFVNKLYDKEFGSSTQRMVIAHMPHFINKDIMFEVQNRFPKEFEQTARHKLRMGTDMQFAFSYYQYIISVKESSDYLDMFQMFDSDNSGVLSDRELRVLATYIYPTPITLETMNSFETGLRECANSRAHSGIVEEPPRYPETYFSPNMPQVTAMLLFNCRQMLDKITAHFNALPKYKHQVQGDVDSQVMFKMLPTNLSALIGMLDEVRHNRKKFICLNDNFDHNQQDAPVARAVVQDFYEGLYPLQSQFELPREYRNRFLHLEELKTWQSFRWKLKFWSHILLGVLVVISIGSYIQERVTIVYHKVSGAPVPGSGLLPK